MERIERINNRQKLTNAFGMLDEHDVFFLYIIFLIKDHICIRLLLLII